MLLHAYYSHAPADPATEPDAEHFIEPGDVMWGDTYDWHWWPESHPRAAELADLHYAELVHTPGLAVCRVTIDMPDDVWEAGQDWTGDFDENPVFVFIDDVEWEHAWLHPAVTVIRQNDLSEQYRRTNGARMERIKKSKEASS